MINLLFVVSPIEYSQVKLANAIWASETFSFIFQKTQIDILIFLYKTGTVSKGS
jgi:hypothetical protein